MRFMRVLGIVKKSALPVAAATAASVLFAAGPAAAASPTAKVSPSSGLANGQTVTVTGNGFPANSALGAILCSEGTWPNVSCDTANAVSITANASGSFSSRLTVSAGFNGISPATGQSGGKVNCLAAPGCSVRVGSADGTVFADPVTVSFAG